MTDPIAEMITRIRNAGPVKKDSVVVSYSKMKHAIADVLLRSGFVRGVEKKGKDTNKQLEITLAYVGNSPRISGIDRVSSFSCRKYFGFKELFPVKMGKGMYIITTPQGVMSDKEAREKKVGGEVILKVW